MSTSSWLARSEVQLGRIPQINLVLAIHATTVTTSTCLLWQVDGLLSDVAEPQLIDDGVPVPETGSRLVVPENFSQVTERWITNNEL